MKVVILPNHLSGNVTLPASKSYLHRAAIAAGLASGKSTLSNVTLNDDVIATLKALKQLDVDYRFINNTLEIMGPADFSKEKLIIDANESGSTLRFLIPLLSQINEVKYIGDKYLFSRPIDVYENIYLKQSLKFIIKEDGLITKGQINSDDFFFHKVSSSQFISGLLFYLPLLNNSSTIKIDNLSSKPYVDMTLDILNKYGIEITTHKTSYFISGQQQYQPCDINIEGDLSQLPYFLVMGALSGPIVINNINTNSLQGDKVFIDFFKSIGANIVFHNNSLIISKSNLNPFTFDLTNNPDLGLILMALASIIPGTSSITNLQRLSLKESNRLKVGQNLVHALGASYLYDELNDKLIITGTKNTQTISEFNTYNDHRVAFTLASISPILPKGIIIDNKDVVNKSYPQFWEDFIQIGGVIKCIN